MPIISYIFSLRLCLFLKYLIKTSIPSIMLSTLRFSRIAINSSFINNISHSANRSSPKWIKTILEQKNTWITVYIQ